MATVATYRIQEDKYAASAEQAGLLADVQRQAKLQAELQRSIAQQAALHAQLAQSQQTKHQAIAKEQRRFVETTFAEFKIKILVHGFRAISEVFHNIAWTSSVTMGFTAVLFLRQRVDNVRREIKFVYWAMGLVCVVLLTHSIFVSLLAIMDGTKLCFQGTRAEHDVRRAFQGMMSLRSHIFWHFMGAFAVFLVLCIFCLWVKFEEDMIGKDGSMLDDKSLLAFGIIVSVLGWCIPTARMARSYRSVRRDFRDDYKTVLVERLQRGEEVVVDPEFVQSLAPQSVRKKLQRAGATDDGRSSRRPMSAGDAARPPSPTAWRPHAAPLPSGSGALGLGNVPAYGGAHFGASEEDRIPQGAPAGRVRDWVSAQPPARAPPRQ